MHQGMPCWQSLKVWSMQLNQLLRSNGSLLNGTLIYPQTARMEYRIGINLGDVMVDGDSIYGDGVNIASRLESLADAGGICISGTAFDQIENKLPLGYKYLGEQTVKNIARASAGVSRSNGA